MKPAAASVQSITRTVEVRDPYTAGHPSRVARLAMAIAKELGLDAERVEAIQIAG